MTPLTRPPRRVAQFPVVSLLALLRSFRYLALCAATPSVRPIEARGPCSQSLMRSTVDYRSTSILGDVAVAAGLIGTIALGLSEGHHPRLPPAKLDLAELPRAAGNIAFLFLIHVVILPIAQAAARRRYCVLSSPARLGRLAHSPTRYPPVPRAVDARPAEGRAEQRP